MKYYIIAGEKSGDLHGAKVMSNILKLDPEATFNYFGGDDMMAVADGLAQHISETSIMGFVEVALNARKISGFFKIAKKTIKSFNPDAILFIDYPGFNLRMAKWAKKEGYKVFYFISPTVWAWKPKRMEVVRNYVDEMMVILPFEKDFYKDHGIDVHYVGNPLMEQLSIFQSDPEFLKKNEIEKPILAILPGSRDQEVGRILASMLDGVKHLENDYEIIVAATKSVQSSLYPDRYKVIYDETYQVLSHADYAVVTSGTATLETALFKVPQVVCYKTNAISFQIAKALVKLKYISLVNIIMDQEIVKELLQNDCTPKGIRNQIDAIIENHSDILNNYDNLYKVLDQKTESTKKVAEIIVDYITPLS